MAKRNFMELLRNRWDEGKFVCVGLDSDIERLPVHMQDRDHYSACDAQLIFNCAIVEATRDIVCAYKPNLAFYMPGNGDYVLRDTIRYIHEVAPGVPVILDAKWGDIGNTNNGYIKKLDWYEADAVTIAPYLGRLDGLEPFVAQADKGIIILCKTSNEGSSEFQDLIVNVRSEAGLVLEDVVLARGGIGVVEEMPLYMKVARDVARDWNCNDNCAVVVGAIFPQQLAEVRQEVGNMPILIPAVGAQGGDLEETLHAGVTSPDHIVIVNNSRQAIFASNGEDYAQAARQVVQKMHDNGTAAMAA